MNRSNAETYRLLVGKLGEDSDCNHKLRHSIVRHCCCCNELWTLKGCVRTLMQTQLAVSQAAEFGLSLPVSDSESEVFSDAADEEDALIGLTDDHHRHDLQPESGTNHVASNTSVQALNSLDISNAYKLAVVSKGRQFSGLLVEQGIAEDFSRLCEDLKVLLSHLSAAQGIEKSMSNVNIDGSETEGGESSKVDQLKQQVEDDKKLLSDLYKELEEERNASTIAANQAMAMITRLQEEKAAFQMEALQNLRMMEEQAEYDMEALHKTDDLLVEKEKEIQDLEAELEFYRLSFPNESIMLEDISQTSPMIL